MQNATGAGATYQWQSGPSNVGPWTTFGGSASSQVTSQIAATWYRCNVTCTNSSSTGTSTPLNVTMNSFLNCYCTAAATSTADDEIFNVTLGSLNNTSACGNVGGVGSIAYEYQNYTGVAAPNLTQGVAYPLSVTVGMCNGFSYSGITGVWIDYNQNGLFTDAGENVYMSPYTAYAVAGTTVSPGGGTITIPLTATVGTTRMRVIETETSVNPTPCTSPTWGEVEDYNVNIILTTLCSGTPTPGNTTTSANPVCSGINFTLGLSTPPSATGITYNWESAPDISGTPGTWVNAGGTNPTFTTSQTAATWYRCLVTCTPTSGSVYSTQLLENMNTLFNCYCSSNATSTADDETSDTSTDTV